MQASHLCKSLARCVCLLRVCSAAKARWDPLYSLTLPQLRPCHLLRGQAHGFHTAGEQLVPALLLLQEPLEDSVPRGTRTASCRPGTLTSPRLLTFWRFSGTMALLSYPSPISRDYLYFLASGPFFPLEGQPCGIFRKLLCLLSAAASLLWGLL